MARRARSSPVFTSQRYIAVAPAARSVSSLTQYRLEKRSCMPSASPFSVRKGDPLATSQILTWSPLSPLANRVPSGLKATETTMLPWTPSVRASPLATSTRRTPLSHAPPPVAMSAPSGLRATPSAPAPSLPSRYPPSSRPLFTSQREILSV